VLGDEGLGPGRWHLRAELLVLAEPVCSENMPEAKIARNTTQPMAMSRGARATRSPVRLQKPVRVGSASPTLGTKGQNKRRPKRSSTDGRRKTVNNRATRMPIAPTKPRLRLLLSVETRPSTRRLTVTVAALARMAGRRRAVPFAWRRDDPRSP